VGGGLGSRIRAQAEAMGLTAPSSTGGLLWRRWTAVVSNSADTRGRRECIWKHSIEQLRSAASRYRALAPSPRHPDTRSWPYRTIDCWSLR
jgi:hypothetical protein